MARKRFSTEQIILLLRKIEIHLSNEMTTSEACKREGISEQTYYRWRNKYGYMSTSEAKRLKDLEDENIRLKRLVADLSLDNAILKDVNSKNF